MGLTVLLYQIGYSLDLGLLVGIGMRLGMVSR